MLNNYSSDLWHEAVTNWKEIVESTASFVCLCSFLTFLLLWTSLLSKYRKEVFRYRLYICGLKCCLPSKNTVPSRIVKQDVQCSFSFLTTCCIVSTVTQFSRARTSHLFYQNSFFHKSQFYLKFIIFSSESWDIILYCNEVHLVNAPMFWRVSACFALDCNFDITIVKNASFFIWDQLGLRS